MRSRRGFTLIEVLVTTVVMSIAFSALLGMLLGAMRQAKKPNQPAIASKLAAERLAYFRSQPNPYLAAGGTYLPPPRDSRNKTNFNVLDGYFNNFNAAPTMLVREFLYAPDTQAGEASRKYQDREVNGRTAATGTTYTSMSWALNEVPATLAKWQRVLPNNDLLAAGHADLQPNTTGVAGPDGAASYFYGVAPRANDRLRGAAFVPVGEPDSLAYVREVWVQTSNPSFLNTPGLPGLVGGCRLPPTGTARPNLDATLAIVYPGTLPGGIAAATLVPTRIPNLPPYSVAVTVRVYAKAKLDRGLPAATRTYPGSATTKPYQLWYDPSRPLATITGIIALQREIY